ncbi:MAG: PaeR7I family type II restriction endonuclease [Candidatus Aquicultorales bacterium]
MANRDFREAVMDCWHGRADAEQRQKDKGNNDMGLRAGVTSGKHLDSLAQLIEEVFVDAGLPADSLFRRKFIELPGYYRAEKQWDIVAVYKGIVVAAIELKSILGSYGNNMNNRAEEAIGSAHDLLQAAETGLLGPKPPWLGYVFVMQNEEASRRPVSVKEPQYSVDIEFKEASYQKRAMLLCRRLVLRRLYDAAWFVTGESNGALETITEPDAELTFAKFSAAITGRVSEILA